MQILHLRQQSGALQRIPQSSCQCYSQKRACAWNLTSASSAALIHFAKEAGIFYLINYNADLYISILTGSNRQRVPSWIVVSDKEGRNEWSSSSSEISNGKLTGKLGIKGFSLQRLRSSWIKIGNGIRQLTNAEEKEKKKEEEKWMEKWWLENSREKRS